MDTGRAHSVTAAPTFIGEEILDPHIYDDHGDPHRAALEDAEAPPISRSTWASIFFLGFTFNPSLSFTISTVFPIIVPISILLQGDLINSSWIASSWSLTGSIAFALAGQLSDIFGRKRILIAGQTALLIGHIVGATAQSVPQIIAAMSILGLGTGMTFVLLPAVTELIPNRYRTLGLLWTEMNVNPFQVFGPLIARMLLQNVSWRWLFYLGIITAVIAMVGTTIFYNPPSNPIQDRTTVQLLSELDYLGIVLYIIGVALLLFGIGAGGTTAPWVSVEVLLPLCLGVVIFASTFVWSFFGPVKRPIFPARLFTKFGEYLVPVVVNFVAGLIYITNSALIPEQIAFTWSEAPVTAGLYNIPAGFGNTIGAVLGGFCFKFGHLRLQLVIGACMQALFTALFALINPDRKALGMVFQALACVPFNWIMFICVVAASLHIQQRDLGLALGLIGGARLLGGAIGSAIYSTILNNKATGAIYSRVQHAVSPLGYPAEKVPGLIAAVSSGVPSATAGIPERVVQATELAIKWGWTDAFRITWYATIPFGVLAVVMAAFLVDPTPYFTKHTA